jgi:hypothetical protein
MAELWWLRCGILWLSGGDFVVQWRGCDGLVAGMMRRLSEGDTMDQWRGYGGSAGNVMAQWQGM